MRLWSLHPNYLDAIGLVTLWRESLLTPNVLLGNTRGYKNHPKLLRFKNSGDPLGAIASCLATLKDEADKRGYKFNNSKIVSNRIKNKIPVVRGQIEYESSHLAKKLLKRDREPFKRLTETRIIKIHPLFKETEGDIKDWERT